MDLSFYKSPLFEEVREEARAEARAEALAEDRAEGRAEDILRLLERRGIGISDDDRERIASCDDLDVLGRWFGRAITAASATEVFADR